MIVKGLQSYCKPVTGIMKRGFSSFLQDNNYFITTPIFYVNASPHLGHVYSAVIADASHRFQKLLGLSNTLFTTGTDEHGLKIQQAAHALHMDPKNYCDGVSSKFQQLFCELNINYTDFIRTTEDRHQKAVCHMFSNLQARDFIYKGKYSGWYCVPDESFLSDSQVHDIKLANGQLQKVSVESGHPVEWNSEENYIFRLSRIQDDIKYWLKDDSRVWPVKFLHMLRRWVSEDLPDLSISRPSSRVFWGLPVPGDEDHTFYVWLDALVNYLTVTGYPETPSIWPPHVHVIGKDILKFHGIYWPAFLLAAGLEPPKGIFCHSHWTVDGEKMSKSKGNVVCPWEKMKKFGVDGLRYFLLHEGVPHSDSNYSEVKVIRMLNSELADTLGNLLSRCVAKSLNPNQIVPVVTTEYLRENLSEEGCKLIQMTTDAPQQVAKHYNDFNFYRGIDVMLDVLRQGNLFVQEEKPWELKNNPSRERLDCCLYVVLETLRVCGILLQPVVPGLSSQLLNTLGVPIEFRQWYDTKPFKAFHDSSHIMSAVNLCLGKNKFFTKIKG